MDVHATTSAPGSYLFVGASLAGTAGASTWVPSTSGYRQVSTTFTTGASTRSVTVWVHGWYVQPTGYVGEVSLAGPAGASSPAAVSTTAASTTTARTTTTVRTTTTARAKRKPHRSGAPAAVAATVTAVPGVTGKMTGRAPG